MKNRTYDILKFIAQIVLPALATFYLGLSQYWNVPNPEAISGTIMLFDTLLGTILGIASAQYKKGEN